MVERSRIFGDDDNRKVRISRLRGDLLTNGRAIDVRQQDVEDDAVERVTFEHRQRLHPISRVACREPVKSQCESQQRPQIVIAFDDEDAAWFSHGRAGMTRESGCCYSWGPGFRPRGSGEGARDTSSAAAREGC